MKRMLLVVLSLCSFCVAEKKPITIVVNHDTPLGITWYVPSRFPAASNKGFAAALAGVQVKCMPKIAVHAGLAKALVIFEVEADQNFVRRDVSHLVVVVDDTPVLGLVGSLSGGGFGVERIQYWDQKDDTSLLRRMAKAKTIWITLFDSNDNRRISVQMTEEQLGMLRTVAEKLNSLTSDAASESTTAPPDAEQMRQSQERERRLQEDDAR